MYSPKNWEFQTMFRLSKCYDRRPRTGLGLPPYIIITHSVKRRQSVKLIRLINTVNNEPEFPLQLGHGEVQKVLTLNGSIRYLRVRDQGQLINSCSDLPRRNRPHHEDQ
ncbi:hypothetical protein TNCV_4527671 [Trichonephila clavipes]|nr:hypothetical protein TNCV_4527671 [Trichonephila clavipes]